MTELHNKRLKSFSEAGLYFVTSRVMSEGRSSIQILRSAIAGGVKLVQLREKDLDKDAYTELAREARALTSSAGVLLIVNDHLDVAIEVGADGVHLGQDDGSIADARAACPDLIIGASTHSIEEAVTAQAEGASYINIGPIFPTGTKEWTGEFLGLEGLREISKHASVPFTVMGGIKKENIPGLVAEGARIIALVTAVTAVDDPEQAVRDLLKIIRDEP